MKNLEKMLEAIRGDLEKMFEGDMEALGSLTISYKGTDIEVPLDYPETFEATEYMLDCLKEAVDEYEL